MKLSLVQFAPEWENKSENMKKLTTILKRNSVLGEILVFPEMTLTGFTMNASAMAEDLKGESAAFFSELARGYRTNVLAGVIEREGKNYFNTLVHLNPSGKLKAKYRKIHPFSYSSENNFYKGGKLPIITNISRLKIGLSICYDLRFPELFRLYAKERVGLIINIANWPDTRIDHWRTLLKARAIENQCYVAGVNRVGNDVLLHYNGFTSLFDPMGKEIAAMENKEAIVTAEIDAKYVKEIREKLPFLEDMRLV
jgi:predicted amidohydrolase